MGNKNGDNPTKHNYDYGLINQEAFQNELFKKSVKELNG